MNAAEATRNATEERDAALDAAASAVAALGRRARAYANRPASKSVLVVEDDEGMQRVLRRLLISEGIAVEVVGSIAEAEERLRLYPPPPVMLLDLGLPDGDAWIFAEQVPRTISLILMSAIDPDDLRALAHRLGVPALAKPFDGAEAVRFVRGALG